MPLVRSCINIQYGLKYSCNLLITINDGKVNSKCRTRFHFTQTLRTVDVANIMKNNAIISLIPGYASTFLCVYIKNLITNDSQIK